MKIKTKDLTGAALDWLVATCEGYDTAFASAGDVIILREGVTDYFDPHRNWGWGGPIIEREGINVGRHEWMGPSMEVISWSAERYATEKPGKQIGPTALIAAMRCLVAAKLGDEVEVPDELL